ncbi:leukemia inhibitory factor-like [Loxodonta africana]|uniref:leukemia inhibitory factor-like n=1 Tax=Loxodonta africana TaxID=9785 RepID=UPI0005404B0D|nr:leukemia inhibitory factor-like [Loxodonta africana]
MELFSWFPGVLLLLVLHQEHGARSLDTVTPSKVTYTTCHTCPGNLTTQIRNKLKQLNGSADGLLTLYCIAQGEPFPSEVDKMCGSGLTDFPPFNAHGRKEAMMKELYCIVTYLTTSLGNITRDQKSLNPQDRNLHGQLDFVATIMQQLQSNVLCLLYKDKVDHVGECYGPNTLGKTFFQKKRLGCQVLFKYKQVITELYQAF